MSSQFGIAGLKFAQYLFGYYSSLVNSPLLPLSEEEQHKLRDILVESGLV